MASMLLMVVMMDGSDRMMIVVGWLAHVAQVSGRSNIDLDPFVHSASIRVKPVKAAFV